MEQDWGGQADKSVTESQKSLACHDAALHQQLGLPFAAKASSAMADVLSGSQKTSLQLELRNVISTVSGSKNDPLTLYLAKMSRHQLDDVMLEMKALAERNEATAKQLLQGSPQLRKALVQFSSEESFLLQQLMRLTPEQLSSLPLDEQQQVLEIQRILHSKPT